LSAEQGLGILADIAIRTAAVVDTPGAAKAPVVADHYTAGGAHIARVGILALCIAFAGLTQVDELWNADVHRIRSRTHQQIAFPVLWAFLDAKLRAHLAFSRGQTIAGLTLGIGVTRAIWEFKLTAINALTLRRFLFANIFANAAALVVFSHIRFAGQIVARHVTQRGSNIFGVRVC
jgi:hypothetical protein